MQIPRVLFQAMLFLAVAGVGGGAVYLLAVLVREWRNGEIW